MITRIVFDMDNTLVDEFGSTVRPGIVSLLDELKQSGKTLMLWTNSTAGRAKPILFDHGLHRYFAKYVFREDYDPGQTGVRKDIRTIGGELLADDDPGEIRYVESIGLRGFLVKAYRKNSRVDPKEFLKLLALVRAK